MTTRTPPTLRILHLSDTHLLADDPTGRPSRHEGKVDTVAAYRHTLQAFENAGPLDVVVVSGDASDDGSPASYRTLRSLTQDFASRHGAVAVYAMGNHDQRTGFREVLGDGHDGRSLTADALAGATPLEAGSPIVGVSEVAGYRIITLDSSVPGRTHGCLDAAQLAWLRDVVATRRGAGSVVVIHHPPVEPVSTLHQGIELINAEALAEVLAASDVVAILSGHYHHHLTDVLLAGSRPIPVVVSSGIVNSNDVMVAPGRERALAGSGGTLITLSAHAARSQDLQPAPAVNDPAPLARVRTLPIRIELPESVSPAIVFDLGETEVRAIAGIISATPAERAFISAAPSAPALAAPAESPREASQ